MYATNEWDKLTEVIVGTARGARVPDLDLSMRLVNYADVPDESTIKTGAYPDIVTQQADEDLEKFVGFLQGEGIRVLRPWNEPNTPVAYYDYCPRDIVFLHGKHAIATPQPIRARAYNYHAIAHHLPDIIEAPRYYADDLYNTACLGDPDTLALTEVAPAFDAANCLKANDHILYLVSNSGNLRGCHQLQEILGNNVKVHPLHDVYACLLYTSPSPRDS